MCGIAGVLNAIYNKDADSFIQDALVVGMVRGFHSTGVMQMDRAGKIWWDKAAQEGLYFAGSKVGKQFISDACRSAITVVHHRWATQGEVNDENAHPFIVHKENREPLVGVHNGSLAAGWKHKPDGDKYEVDSKWALAHIAKHGIDAFKDFYGPYCFVWTEADKRGKVFMVRNLQRPMHLLFTEDKKTMMFASEPGMLNWLAERNNMKPEKDILVLTPERLYEFDTTGSTVTYKSTPLPRAAVVVTTNTQSSLLPPTITNPGKTFIDNIKKAAKGKLLNMAIVEEEKKIDAAINAALAKNADAALKRTLDSMGMDDDEEDVVSQRDDDAPFLEDSTELVPTTWFTARSTKKNERELAVKIGFFRELHWLSGVAWDEDTGDLLGDVEVWDSKSKEKQVYTGMIRSISQARAHTDYIDNGKRPVREGGWVVVTGAFDDKALGTVFVCSELNMIGKEAMRDQHKKAH